MNLDQLLETAARSSATLTVRSGLAAPVVKSFPEVVADVRVLQSALEKLGVQPGHIVGLHASPSYECIVWNLALVDMHVVPQVFPEDWSLAEAQVAASTYRMAFVVSQLAGTLVIAPDLNLQVSHDAA